MHLLRLFSALILVFEIPLTIYPWIAGAVPNNSNQGGPTPVNCNITMKLTGIYVCSLISNASFILHSGTYCINAAIRPGKCGSSQFLACSLNGIRVRNTPSNWRLTQAVNCDLRAVQGGANGDYWQLAVQGNSQCDVMCLYDPTQNSKTGMVHCTQSGMQYTCKEMTVDPVDLRKVEANDTVDVDSLQFMALRQLTTDKDVHNEEWMCYLTGMTTKYPQSRGSSQVGYCKIYVDGHRWALGGWSGSGSAGKIPMSCRGHCTRTVEGEKFYVAGLQMGLSLVNV